MSQSHKDIPDALRHEPKGASSAHTGQVPVANGDGTTTFKHVSGSDYASMSISNNTTVDAVLANATPHTDSNYVSLAARYSTDFQKHISIAAGVITLPSAGVYEILGYSTAKSSGSNATIYMAYKVAGTLSSRVEQARTHAAGDYVSLMFSAVLTGVAGTEIEIFIGSNVAADLTINDSSILVKLLEDTSV